MENLSHIEASKLSPRVIDVEVNREDIYKTMITFYKRRHIATSKIRLSFADEDAGGDGVARDAYSAFFEEVLGRWEGTCSKVPNSQTDHEELNLIGKIITHAFISFRVFPLTMCKATLKHFLGFKPSNAELKSCFLSYLPDAERKLFEGDTINQQGIIDILSESSVYDLPTRKNLDEIVVKAAKTSLIKKPAWSFQAIIEGMGSFWKNVTPEMIDSLYEISLPTSQKILDSLDEDENSPQDGRISTWLRRYIRSSNQQKLKCFMRFISGSEVLLPNSVIKVVFENQPNDHLRPRTQTCFKILILGRQYSNFYEFEKNFDFDLMNNNVDTMKVYDK